MKCENCGQKINVAKTALKLCNSCFEEKCVCGHKRAMHVDNKRTCINQKNWRSNDEYCKCKKFKLKQNNREI